MANPPLPPLPYASDAERQNDWLTWSNRTANWVWRKDHGQWRWTTGGPCPRCNDATTVDFAVVRDSARLSTNRLTEAELAAVIPKLVQADCLCPVAHPPNKAGDGCGASWYIEAGDKAPRA